MGSRRPAVRLAFLDSSVLFSSVNSPSGGSAKLFTLRDLKLVVSTLVLTEVERNIREKLKSYHLERFFILVNELGIIKDAPILASFLISKAEFLVTLDKKHFLIDSVENFIKPSRVVTPKMLIDLD